MNILFVTAHAPYPLHTGSGQRSALIYDALSKIGNVRTITLESQQAFTAEQSRILKERYNLVGYGPVTPMGKHGLWSALYKINKKASIAFAHNLDGSKSRFKPDNRLIEKLNIAHHVAECDVIVGRYTQSLTRLGLLSNGKPTFLDVDDLGSELYGSRLCVSKNPIESKIISRHKNNILAQEQSIFSQIDGIWIANPDNNKSPGLNHATLLPNIPYSSNISDFNRKTIDPKNRTIVAIGAFKHQPNVEGIQWFIDNVWLDIVNTIQGVKLRIVGSNLTKVQQAAWSSVPNVEISGYVQDIKDAYSECALTICTVLRGAGTNIKVLESGAHLRNCVTTEVAARGYHQDTELMNHLFVGKNAQEITQYITSLLLNPETNNKKAIAFQKHIAKNYSKNRVNDIIVAAMSKYATS